MAAVPRVLSRALRVALCVLSLAAMPSLGFAQTTNDLFDDNTVQDLQLLVNSSDWAKLKTNFFLNDYFPADVHWHGMIVRNIGIRSRGTGSRSSTKPGLRLDFDRYTSDQNFLGLKSLALDNLWQDPSMVRERVAMKLFQRLGHPVPREVHARLWVNGSYVGLYTVIESIDKAFLGRVFGADARGGVENDGYLYEYKWKAGYHFEDLGQELEAYAGLFEAKTHEKGSMFELYDPIKEMFWAINHASDSLFVEEVGKFLDLNRVMTYVAAQSFLAEDDGFLGLWGAANFYFYRFEGQTRGQFLHWDSDRYGNDTSVDIFRNAGENVLMSRALAVPELRAAYFDALRNVVASATDADWLEKEIQRQVDQIQTAAYEDALKPETNGKFDDAVAKLLAFAHERPAQVMYQIVAIPLLTR